MKCALRVLMMERDVRRSCRVSIRCGFMCVSSLENGGTVECPFDRIKHRVPPQGIQDFPTNQRLLNLALSRETDESYSQALQPETDTPRLVSSWDGQPAVRPDLSSWVGQPAVRPVLSSWVGQPAVPPALRRHVSSMTTERQHLSSSRTTERRQPLSDLCELHGEPFIQFSYNIVTDTHERFCESCLNPDRVHSYTAQDRAFTSRGLPEPSVHAALSSNIEYTILARRYTAVSVSPSPLSRGVWRSLDTPGFYSHGNNIRGFDFYRGTDTDSNMSDFYTRSWRPYNEFSPFEGPLIYEIHIDPWHSDEDFSQVGTDIWY